MKIAVSWSGGKDSCFALMQSLKNNKLECVLNMMNENGKVSRSHGLPVNILNQQAEKLGVPLVAKPTSWNDYEVNFIDSLKFLKKEYNIEGVVFGDIDLQAHRDWEEMVCKKTELHPILPLWKRNRRDLVLQMIDSGIETIIVSCNTQMGEQFLGKKLDKQLIEELESIGIDACGENGEFHTLVTNCSLFSEKISLPSYSKQVYNDYCFIVWNNE